MSNNLTDNLAGYFAARPEQWIDGRLLGPVAGAYAWRSRVSDLRTKRGMTIENRTRAVVVNGTRYRISEYRYVPERAA